MRRYFELSLGPASATDDSRWHLRKLDVFADGTPVDMWGYRGCKPVADPKCVPFHVFAEGTKTDYTPTAFLTTVVSKRLADLWESFGPHDIQRIPASVDGVENEWEVINILTCIDCIDYQRSKASFYPPNDPERPNKPRGFLKLVLDPVRIGEHHIFQPIDWEVVTVVSEDLKHAMQEAGMTGVQYWRVTD